MKNVPFVLHRAIFGSLERFIGILLEYYQGLLPLWMAPIQLKILSIDESVNEQAKILFDELWDNDIRVEMDLRQEHINAKILKAREEKIPYMVILGHKELQSGKFSIRSFSGEKFLMDFPELKRRLKMNS